MYIYPDFYAEISKLATEELNEDLEDVVNEDSSEQESSQIENSIYNFNAILDAIED